MLDNDSVVTILRREARRAADVAAREAQAAREAEDLAEAQTQADLWRQEYARLLSARPALRAELASVDAALPAAVDALRAAHEHVTGLLARRATAEEQAKRNHNRLSRLSGWLGDRDWRADVISIGDAPLPWALLHWVSRPWPRE